MCGSSRFHSSPSIHLCPCRCSKDQLCSAWTLLVNSLAPLRELVEGRGSGRSSRQPPFDTPARLCVHAFAV
eukprot:348673-Prorocentrum_minimum.AAC.2